MLKMPFVRKSKLVGHVDRIENGRIFGWAADALRPEVIVDVILYVDGRSFDRCPARSERPDLVDIGLSTKHGFELDVLPTESSPATSIRIVIASGRDEADITIGECILTEIGRHLRNEIFEHSSACIEAHSLENWIVQHFVSGDMVWNGLSIRLHLPSNHHDLFELAIYKRFDGRNSAWREDSPDYSLVKAMQVDTDIADSAGAMHIYFDPLECSKEDVFAVLLRASSSRPGNPVCVWLTSDKDRRIRGHLRCTREMDLGLFTGFMADLIGDVQNTSKFPEALLYSPLSSCNMNCVHCISQDTRKRVNKIAEPIKHEIASQARHGALKGVFTDYSGDILFAEAKNAGELDYLFSLGVAIHIDTNGAYLSRGMSKRIMKSPVDAVGISVDAGRASTYKRIRVGSPPLDKIFENVRILNDERQSHGRSRSLSIHMSFTLMRSNIDELEEFIQKAAASGADAVNCRHLEIYKHDMKSETLFLDKELFNRVRSDALLTAKRLGIHLNIGGELRSRPSRKSRRPCYIPWSTAVVLANGDVMACCVPGSKIGSVAEQKLEEIWNGAEYRRLRATVNSNEPASLCKTCQYRHELGSKPNQRLELTRGS